MMTVLSTLHHPVTETTSLTRLFADAVCDALVDAKARRGELPGFTGVSDPYEPPLKATLSIDTTSVAVDTALAEIFRRVVEQVTN